MKDINKNPFACKPQQVFSVLVITGILSLSLSAVAIAQGAMAAPSYLAQQAGQSNSLPRSVANAVLQDLSKREGIPVSKLKIAEYSRQSWTDGCLGLPNPDELCTQVIVEGWHVVVSDGSQQWVYRTDASGRNVRLENPNGTASLPSTVANTVIKDATERTKPRIVKVERRTWPNSCFGLNPPGVFCATVAIPGWLVTVVAGQQRLVYRTDDGNTVLFDEAASQIDNGTIKPVPIPESQLPLPSGVIFREINSGGIAGLTTQITLQNDGRLIQVQERNGTTSQTQLTRISPQQVQQFQQLLQQQQFAQFSGLEYPPPAGAADFITVTLTSPDGTTRYTDIDRDRLPRSLQAIVQAWNQIVAAD